MRILPLALLAPFVSARPALADDVYLLDGTIVRDVVVFEENLKEVKWRKGRAETVKPASEVLRVDHDKTVEDWDEALRALEARAFDAAVSLFKDAAQNERASREEYRWLKPYGLFRAAEVLRMAGKLDEAVAAFDDFLKACPEHRIVPEAALKKAFCLRMKGDGAGTQAVLRRLIDDVAAKGLPERWKFEAELDLLLLNAALPADKKRDELLRLYEATLDKFPPVANRCKVEVGNSYIAERKYREAKEYFDGIVSDPRADPDTIAGAYLGRGDCYFLNAGNFGGSREADYRAARDDYLRVVVLFKDRPQYVGKALLFAGRCFDFLGGDLGPERAKELWQRCRKEFPGTPWGKEAVELLQAARSR